MRKKVKEELMNGIKIKKRVWDIRERVEENQKLVKNLGRHKELTAYLGMCLGAGSNLRVKSYS